MSTLTKANELQSRIEHLSALHAVTLRGKSIDVEDMNGDDIFSDQQYLLDEFNALVVYMLQAAKDELDAL